MTPEENLRTVQSLSTMKQMKFGNGMYGMLSCVT